jgi:hypothetical protein
LWLPKVTAAARATRLVLPERRKSTTIRVTLRVIRTIPAKVTSVKKQELIHRDELAFNFYAGRDWPGSIRS